MKRMIVRTAGVILTAALLLAALGSGSAHAVRVEPWYVTPTGSPTGACDTWAAACDLQHALSLALPGDQVWVKKGLYHPTSDRTDRYVQFVIASGLKVYGGFAGTETSLAQRNWKTNRTILSGDIDRNDTNVDGNRVAEKWTHIKGGNSYHVVVMNGTNTPVDAGTVLDGFIITAGDATTSWTGGGLLCSGGNGDQCSPTLAQLIFSGNRANSGGAISLYGNFAGVSSPTLEDVTFRGNYAYGNGGGMLSNGYMGTSSPVLTDVTFIGNTSGSAGGAMYNDGEEGGVSSPSFKNVTFDGNRAVGDGSAGGAVYNNGRGGTSSPQFVNATFRGNQAQFGGAMYNFGTGSSTGVGASSPSFTNVTFNVNAATGPYGEAGAVYNDGRENFGFAGASAPTFTNVILWGDTGASGPEIYNATGNPQIQYSIVQGGDAGIGGDSGLTAYSTGTANKNENPLLNPLKFNGGATMTMTLKMGSPAVDVGLNAGCALTADQRGMPRPQGDYCDIGAVEAQYLTKTFISQGAADGWVLETAFNAAVGGSINAGSTKLLIGDDASDRQYRTILSFNTAPLPDGTVIPIASLKIKQSSVVGVLDPFAVLSPTITIDLKRGSFGTSALQAGDFQAVATYPGGGLIQPLLVDGWYTGGFDDTSVEYINRAGLTQLRLFFATPTNTNGESNAIEAFSGNAPLADRPQLIVKYIVP